MRVALAAALFVRPSILLLDEPTNHLDLEAVIWLEEYIRTELASHQILVCVSHDKHFLNEVRYVTFLQLATFLCIHNPDPVSLLMLSSQHAYLCCDASHKWTRDLEPQICTDIVHFYRSKLKCYKGDFFTFEKV